MTNSNSRNEPVRYEVEGPVALITIDAPPVNALSAEVRIGIFASLARAAESQSVEAIVVTGGGRAFSAGADIREFGRTPCSPTLRELLQAVEDSPKPVVAAIQGVALGGGLELALAAHYRIAETSARCGFPEVRLGLLPGAGGTQRLPRIVGVAKALEMIVGGGQIGAAEALAIGLVDEIAEERQLGPSAIRLAARVSQLGGVPRKVRDRQDKLDKVKSDPEIFERFRAANAKRLRGALSPDHCIRAIQAAVLLPFEVGMARERALFDLLLADSQSAALRYLFFSERQVGRSDADGSEANPRSVRRVAVIGAGTMGGGIAMAFANAAIPVTLVDAEAAALDRGLAIIRRNYEASAAKGKLTPAQIEERLARIVPSLRLADVVEADLVIEAVFEDLAVKRDLFAQLDALARDDAILATNTSYLDVAEIGGGTARPERVIGLHFFSPAHVMKLLEIVRTARTAPAVVVTAAKLARTIGKVGIVVGNGYGFVGNRMLAVRDREANRLVLEGASTGDVDRLLYDFGFPMGHFQMRDLVGLDVGWKRETSSASTVREILNEMGRHGQKAGAGYYDYDAQRRPTPSPLVAGLIEDFSAASGITRRPVGDTEILDRLLLAMVNEGANILEEGIATRASDVDLVWVTGYGWPRHRGGPMFWADQLGLAEVVRRLRARADRHGKEFEPSPLLERLVAEGRSLTGAPRPAASAPLKEEKPCTAS
jgi:3-hydroxyacyl-CoA dehydrogenase